MQRNLLHWVFTLFICLSALLISLAQTPEFEWVQQFENTPMSHSACWGRTAHQPNGNVLHLNWLNHNQESLDIDPGDGVFMIYNTGFSTTYLACHTADGDFLWGKQLGINQEYKTLNTDSQGNIYITGTFGEILTIDDNKTSYSIDCSVCEISSNVSGGYVLKMDELGSVQWLRKISDYGATVTSAHINAEDQLCICGSYYGYEDYVNDFDSGPDVFDFNDGTTQQAIFAVKLNPENGDNLTLLNMNTDGSVKAGSIVEDEQGRVWLTGIGFSTVDFDLGDGVNEMQPTETGTTNFDFLACYTWEGELEHLMKFAEEDPISSSTRVPLRMHIREGQLFLAANGLNLSGDLNPGAGELLLDGGGTYLMALNTQGEFLWGNQFDHLSLRKFELTALGNPAICGGFANTIDLNTAGSSGAMSSSGGFDYCIASYNAENGVYMHGFKIGGNLSDQCNDISFCNTGQMTFCGCFQGSADFETGSQSTILDAGDDYDVNSFLCAYQYDIVNSLNDAQMTNDLLIWPNPSDISTNINLSLGSDFITGVEMISPDGKSIYHLDGLRSNSLVIPAQSLSPGVYLLRITAKDIKYNRQLIIR
jgi:hypothetical protein